MFTISIDPIIFQIGHFALRWYGLIALAAIQIVDRFTFGVVSEIRCLVDLLERLFLPPCRLRFLWRDVRELTFDSATRIFMNKRNCKSEEYLTVEKPLLAFSRLEKKGAGQ